jgi:hypothetical protein
MTPHHLEMGRSVNGSMMEPRQQHSAFQVFQSTLEFDAPALELPVERFDDILGRHGPSWAKRAALNCEFERSFRALKATHGRIGQSIETESNIPRIHSRGHPWPPACPCSLSQFAGQERGQNPTARRKLRPKPPASCSATRVPSGNLTAVVGCGSSCEPTMGKAGPGVPRGRKNS